jgi:hypothetical protein
MDAFYIFIIQVNRMGSVTGHPSGNRTFGSFHGAGKSKGKIQVFGVGFRTWGCYSNTAIPYNRKPKTDNRIVQWFLSPRHSAPP